MAAKAKTKSIQVSNYKVKAKVSRPGIEAKTKTSKNKNSKNYKKLYRGQGK